MYRTERNDYDGVSTFSIEIYLESDNKTYRIIDTPICFTYLDFFYAVQRDRYLLDFLFDPALMTSTKDMIMNSSYPIKR